MRRRRALAAGSSVLCALVLGVSGCGGNAKPQPLPRPTASLSPSASPTPPVMPAAAKAKTKAGAIAFGRHYIELINHAQATGEVDSLSAAETVNCATCAQSRAAIEAVYASGATVEGGDWSIKTMNALKNPATRGWLLELIVGFGPQTVDRPGSTNDQELDGGQLPVNLQLVWRGSAWKVAECTRGA